MRNGRATPTFTEEKLRESRTMATLCEAQGEISFSPNWKGPSLRAVCVVVFFSSRNKSLERRFRHFSRSGGRVAVDGGATVFTARFSLLSRPRQVSSWVTHLIVSPPSHDERKAVLACLIRTAVVCWNLGNFHAATEIVVGLRYCFVTSSLTVRIESIHIALDSLLT